MAVKKQVTSAKQLNKYIVKGIQEKKGTDIIILNLEKTENAIADFFVICTGGSDAQVDAITESIEKEVFIGTEQNPWHKEGMKNKEWILLDYVDIVVHIFKGQSRAFYSLEDLWGDATVTKVEDDEDYHG
jgi:ribosome-associated protein